MLSGGRRRREALHEGRSDEAATRAHTVPGRFADYFGVIFAVVVAVATWQGLRLLAVAATLTVGALRSVRIWTGTLGPTSRRIGALGRDPTLIGVVVVTVGLLAWPLLRTPEPESEAGGSPLDAVAQADGPFRIAGEVDPAYGSWMEVWNELARLEGRTVYLNLIWNFDGFNDEPPPGGDQGLAVWTKPGDIAYAEDPDGFHWGPHDDYADDDGGLLIVQRVCSPGEINVPVPEEEVCDRREIEVAADPSNRSVLWYEHGYYHLQGRFFVNSVSVEHMFTRTIELIPSAP